LPAPLILASTSPYRRALLARLGLVFTSQSPGVAELAMPGERADALAIRLARDKAASVAHRRPGAWVLAADQVADCGGRTFGKPGDAAGCRAQLAASSGRTVVFHTAFVLVQGAAAPAAEHVDRTEVRFRVLSAHEISAYVERDRPYDCAGGFRCEGLGVALFERVATEDPTALVGLPLIAVAAALRRVGFDALAPGQS